MSMVGWVLRELKDHGFTVESIKKRCWNDRMRLIKEWVEDYPMLRSKIHLGKYYTQDENWWKTVDLNKYGAVLGGEISATNYADKFKPKLGSIYVGKNKEASLIRDLQLVSVDDLNGSVPANVEILSKFWGDAEDNTLDNKLTHPLITHADLMDTWDPKCREIAEKIADLYFRG